MYRKGVDSRPAAITKVPIFWRSWLYAVLLALIAIGGIRYETTTAPNWPFDGYTYAIRMQMDAGIPYVRARTNARLFYADKPSAANPLSRQYLNAAYPRYWALFAPRILYPLLSSLLWSKYGMQSLLVVSNAAFVVSIILLYLLQLRFTIPGLAFILSLSCAAWPEIRLLGTGPLTDMLAFAFFVGTLYALVRFVATENRWWYAAYSIILTLATLTRPLPYILLVAGLWLALSGVRGGNRQFVRLGVATCAPALLLCVLVIVMEAFTHAPSFVSIITYYRTFSHHLAATPFWLYYALIVVEVTALSVAKSFTIFAAPLGIVALFGYRGRAETAIFLGVLAASVPTILLDPLTGDISRVVMLPLLPVFVYGLALGATTALSHWRSEETKPIRAA